MGQYRYVTHSPQVSLPHPPPTQTSLDCLLYTPTKPVSGDIRILIEYPLDPIFLAPIKVQNLDFLC